MYEPEDQQNDVYEIKINDTDDVNEEKISENSQVQKENNSAKNDKIELKDEKENLSENNHFGQIQRLKAEFANYKKRMENERILLSELIRSEFIKSLLPVIDDFDRLVQHLDAENQDVKEGIKIIYQKFMNTLSEQGLSLVKSVGEKFDPNFHEALLAEHHEDAEEDIVIEEWRKGYLFKDRLLRPAQVKVNKIQN